MAIDINVDRAACQDEHITTDSLHNTTPRLSSSAVMCSPSQRLHRGLGSEFTLGLLSIRGLTSYIQPELANTHTQQVFTNYGTDHHRNNSDNAPLTLFLSSTKNVRTPEIEPAM